MHHRLNNTIIKSMVRTQTSIALEQQAAQIACQIKHLRSPTGLMESSSASGSCDTFFSSFSCQGATTPINVA